MPMPNQTDQLKGQMPIANQAAAQSTEAANQMNLQQQMKSAGTQGPAAGPAAAQQMGADLAKKQGAVQTSLIKSNAQNTMKQAETGIKDQKLARDKRNAEHTVRIEEQRAEQESKFKTLGRDVDRTLVQSRRKFEEGARGDRFTSDRQLQDFMVSQRLDEQAFADYEQDYMQAIDRDITEMETASNIFLAETERMFKSGEAAKDRETYERLVKYKEHLDRQAAAAKRKKSKQGKIIGGLKVAAGVVLVATGAGAGVGAGLIVSGASDTAKS